MSTGAIASVHCDTPPGEITHSCDTHGWRQPIPRSRSDSTARWAAGSSRAGGEPCQSSSLLDSDAVSSVDARIFKHRDSQRVCRGSALKPREQSGAPAAAPQNWYQPGAAWSSTPEGVTSVRLPLRGERGSMSETAPSATKQNSGRHLGDCSFSIEAAVCATHFGA